MGGPRHAEEKDQEKNDEDTEVQKQIERKIEVYQKALDDLVGVNSVFTVAVFMGLSFATPDPQSLDDRVECNAANSLAKGLIVFEVVSFSWFLFSSLAAKTLKVDLKGFGVEAFEGIRLKIDRQAMLYGSVLASVLGCLFLLISMVNVIQIRLGKLSCRSGHTLGAAVSLIVIVSLALITYVCYAILAIVAVHQSGFLFQREPKAQKEAESVPQI